MTDRGELWWRLQKGSAPVDVEWGSAHGTLLGTDFKLREGPPVTIGFSLDRNFKTRSKSTGRYMDATTLADGGIGDLQRVEISNPHVVSRLVDHLRHIDDTTEAWLLLVELRGKQHAFHVQPESRRSGAGEGLVLRVVRRAAEEDKS